MVTNPHQNPYSWAFMAWQEGYNSDDDEENPYSLDEDVLAAEWQCGREIGILDRYNAEQAKRSHV